MIKNALIFLVVFFITSAIGVTFLTSRDNFMTFITGASGFTKLKESNQDSIFPNTFSTISEQTPATLQYVINEISMGRPYLFYISLFGILSLFFKKFKKKKNKKCPVSQGDLQ